LVHGIHLAVRDVLNNSTANEGKSEYNKFVESEQENIYEDGDYNEDGDYKEDGDYNEDGDHNEAGVITIVLQILFLII
jgi:hypothetical protein